MVSVDVYRPAAREQLRVIARDVKLPVYEGTPDETTPLDLARRRAAKTPSTPAATCCWSIPPAACTSTTI